MLTRDEQAEILRRFVEHTKWVVTQRTRVARGQIDERSFDKRRKVREAEFADFLKECGDVPHIPVLKLSDEEHVSEGASRVQAGPQVPALQPRPVLRRQGEVEA